MHTDFQVRGVKTAIKAIEQNFPAQYENLGGNHEIIDLQAMLGVPQVS